MATLHLTATTTVADLRKEFNDAFGAQVKVYNGRSQASMEDRLSNIGLSNNGEFVCRSSLTVASFIERMQNEFGLKVKVYTCDEWVAVLDGLTLESAGKVKKNAVKADMESMIAYQRTENDDPLNGYSIVAEDNGGYSVYQNGVLCDNAKGAMREIAALIGLEVDPAWTTRQFGAKLIKAIGGTTPIATEKVPVDDNAAAIEFAKLAAKKAKAEAEKEAAIAKSEAENAQMEAIAAAKAAADKAKAEVEKQKAEAEAAKAELARIQAEAAKAKAEAEAAKAAAEKVQAEAKKSAEAPASTAPTKTSNNTGVLNGLFSVASNKKVRFSMGNLQYNPQKWEWRLAEKQYDIIGEENLKVEPNSDAWVDIFGYGTSGYKGLSPLSTYGFPSTSITNTNYDWGQYNPIINGGNKEGLWRTMTSEEWSFILDKRPDAKNLMGFATIANHQGLVLLPDDFFEHRMPISFTSGLNSVYSSNVYNEIQWKLMEDHGAVFFPANGDWLKSEHKFANVKCGSYHSADVTSHGRPFLLKYRGCNIDDYRPYCKVDKFNLQEYASVRLVQDVK